jgi:hypothetical protein
VTFKELRKIIAEKNKETGRESKFYNPNYYWKGRKVVSLSQWLKIRNSYGIKAALQYFPNDFPRSGFTFIFLYGGRIEDQTLMQEVELWRSDFIKLMEYSKNTEYGKTKCCRCLLSTDREEAGIFMGINKVVSRSLDAADNVSVYPCRVLNRFACPYDRKMTVVGGEENISEGNNQNQNPDVDYLFYLSELAFGVELALAKAQEEHSVFRIRNAADAYQVLTNKETLEKVLQQGLKEEHMQYKDKIVEFLRNMKDRIKIEDLTVY